MAGNSKRQINDDGQKAIAAGVGGGSLATGGEQLSAHEHEGASPQQCPGVRVVPH